MTLRPSSAPYRKAHGFDFIPACICSRDVFCYHVIIQVFKCMNAVGEIWRPFGPKLLLLSDIFAVIIHQIFSLVQDWPKQVT